MYHLPTAGPLRACHVYCLCIPCTLVLTDSAVPFRSLTPLSLCASWPLHTLAPSKFVGAEDEAATVAALASAVETLEAKSKRSDEL